MAKGHRFTINDEKQIAIDLIHLEQAAHKLGLVETARAINAATQKIGWEIAHNADLARRLDNLCKSEYQKGK